MSKVFFSFFSVFLKGGSLLQCLIKCFSLCVIPGNLALVLGGVRVHILGLHQRRVSRNDCLHTERRHEMAFLSP